MPLVISGLNEAFHQLQTRAITGARAALRDAGEIVIEGIKANFDAKGARGDNDEWPPVPISWLSKRQTWPHDPSSQASYIRDHYPLIDTGALRNSYVYLDQETSEGDIEGAVQSPLPYDEDQEKGVPGKIRARHHIFVIEEDMVLATAAVAERMGEAIS